MGETEPADQAMEVVKGRVLRKSLTILALVSASVFVAIFLFFMLTSRSHVLPYEIHSQAFGLSLLYAISISAILLGGSLTVRLLLWRKRRWFHFALFGLGSLLSLAFAGLFAVALVQLVASVRSGQAADFRVYDDGPPDYISATDPHARIFKQGDAIGRLIRDSGGPIRYNATIDLGTLDGVWQEFGGGSQFRYTLTFSKGKVVKREAGPGWTVSRSTAISASPGSAILDPESVYYEHDSALQGRHVLASPFNILDGDPSTAWITRDEKGEMALELGDPVNADGIGIQCDNVRSLTIEFRNRDVAGTQTFALAPDQRGLQYFPLEGAPSIKSLSVKVGGAYRPGEELSIRELRLREFEQPVILALPPRFAYSNGSYELPPHFSALQLRVNAPSAYLYGYSEYGAGSYDLVLYVQREVGITRLRGVVDFPGSGVEPVEVRYNHRYDEGSWEFDRDTGLLHVSFDYEHEGSRTTDLLLAVTQPLELRSVYEGFECYFVGFETDYEP